MSDTTSDDTTRSEVHVNQDGEILRLHIDRTRVRNALDQASLEMMADEVQATINDDRTRAIVLTAEGDHFCAGIDLPSVNQKGQRRPRTGHVERGIDVGAHRLVRGLWRSRLPVVAAVRGHAAGLGCQLAMACDFVLVSPTARFSEPFVQRGLSPDSGGTFLLPRLVGLARAKAMLLLGEVIDGEQAADWGLVHRLVDDDELDDAAEELAQRCAAMPTVAVGLAKDLVHSSLEHTFEQALADEARTEELPVRSADFKEGLAAFLDKRDPKFEGR